MYLNCSLEIIVNNCKRNVDIFDFYQQYYSYRFHLQSKSGISNFSLDIHLSSKILELEQK